ncbi:CIC11C00000002938 [Sungouiella intermedia]|uniref:histidinol-phosphate transaminase n=1 Tax=Sungouiella intermedia TaxID=45354 RepID=A0A1L0BCG7_9ASCO|nr:CIC11C00000002938 [[Candida] intermedia]SGZ53035.1 CIC11C00000005749 [[Candida] intermedia]
MAFNLLQLVRENIRTLEPYRCARDDFKEGILLDANENTHGPALESISTWEQALELNRYPDPHQIELKEQIAAFRNALPNKYLDDYEQNKLTPQNLCLGVGSDESIDMLMRCVCSPGKDKLLICPPTYGMYSICATVNDVQMVKVPLTLPDFEVDVAGVLDAVTKDSTIKLVYLTSPGNPTAKLLSVDGIVELLKSAEEKWNGLVIVDEAYIDFTLSDDPRKSLSVSTLVNEYPNLVVMQTLSKSFGLAGIRLGITYSSKELSGYLNAMKYPYNISSLTSAVASRSTAPGTGLEVMKKFVNEIISQRAVVLSELQKLPGVGRNIGGLDANFILIEILDKDGVPSNEVANKLYNKLAVENGVVVRFRGKEPNCTGALRVSIGTVEENKILVDKFAKCLLEVRG